MPIDQKKIERLRRFGATEDEIQIYIKSHSEAPSEEPKTEQPKTDSKPKADFSTVNHGDSSTAPFGKTEPKPDRESGRTLSDLVKGTPDTAPRDAEGHKYRGFFPRAGAALVRGGTGLVSGVLSAEPGVGTLTGGAVAGAGEALAQKMEREGPVDKSTVALESGLGAAPLGKFYKPLKAAGSIGKQIALNVARGGGLMEAGNMARRWNETGDIAPHTLSEWAIDAGTTALGAMFGLGGARRVNGKVVTKEAADAAKAAEKAKFTDIVGASTPTTPRAVTTEKHLLSPNRVDTVTEAEAEAAQHGFTKGSPNSADGRLVQTTAGRTSGKGTGAIPVADRYTAMAEKAGIKDVPYEEGIKDVPGGSRAAHVADPGEATPRVKTEINEAIKTPSKIRESQLDADGLTRRPDAQVIAIGEAKDRADAIAKANLAENQRVQKIEQALAKKEEAADLARTKVTAKGTDADAIAAAEKKAAEAAQLASGKEQAGALDKSIKVAEADRAAKAKQIMDDAIQEAKNLNERDKALRIQKAEAAIKKLLESGNAKASSPVIKKTTEAVPTPAGKMQASTTIIQKKPKKGAKGKNPLEVDPAKTAVPAPELAGEIVPEPPVVPPVVPPKATKGKKGVVPVAAAAPIVETPPIVPPKAEVPPVVPPVAPPIGETPVISNQAGTPLVPEPSKPTIYPNKAKAEASLKGNALGGEAVQIGRGQWVAKINKEPKVPPVVPPAPPVEPPIPPIEPPPTAPLPTGKPPKGPKGRPPSTQGTVPPAPGVTRVDLAGAADSKEVQNRVLNALQEYKAKVVEAEGLAGVDEKGVRTQPTVEPLVLEVPNGPTFTVKPEQIDNVITRLEEGLKPHVAAYGGSGKPEHIKPDDAFRGIVDDPSPRPTKVNMGSGVKIPIAPIAKREAALPPEIPTTTPVAQATSNPTNLVGTNLVGKGKTPVTDAILNPTNTTLASVDKAASTAPVKTIAQAEADFTAADKAYGEMKDAVKAGTAKPEDLRAAGKAYGEAKSALANARKEAEGAGSPSPLAEVPSQPVNPNLPPNPPAKRGRPAKLDAGPSSTDLAQMSPEDQESALKSAVEAFKKLSRGRPRGTFRDPEEGATIAEIMRTVGVTGVGMAAGAKAGADANPDDPMTGALIGAALGGATGFAGGLYAPSVYKTLVSHLSDAELPPAVREASMKKVAAWTADTAKTAIQMVPDYLRASYLSSPSGLLANAWVGPWGGSIMGLLPYAMTGDTRALPALKTLLGPQFLKNYLPSLKEAHVRIMDASERTEGVVGKVGPMAFRRTVAFVPELLTAGDISVRRILMSHGFSEAEARAINLTSEPLSATIKAFGNARKTRVMNSKGESNPSLFWQLALPFYKTRGNQLEQSFLRTPFGNALRRKWNVPEVSRKMLIAESGTSLGVATTSYLLGTWASPENARNWNKFLTNFMGPFGVTAQVAFAAGLASQDRGNGAVSQLAAASKSFTDGAMPMPGPDLMVDTSKAVIGALRGETPDLPYGFVPPPLSSKQRLSVPTILRGENPWSTDTPVTKQELSVLAALPGVKPEMKKPEKRQTQLQKDLKRRRDEIKKSRQNR